MLERILTDKRSEIAAKKALMSRVGLERAAARSPAPRNFSSALGAPPGDRTPRSQIRLIAEIKKASPSKGLIRAEFDPVQISTIYEQAGASAISVITDEKYFQGNLDYLTAVRKAVNLPVLRKDFILDEYQIYESRAAGADAILLIAAVLPTEELYFLRTVAEGIGMGVLVEVHTEKELNAALNSGARIIGINNRDLHTFETRLDVTLGIAPSVPGDRILVSESGIFSRADVERLISVGVDAILVGESLMRESNPDAKIKELLGL